MANLDNAVDKGKDEVLILAPTGKDGLLICDILRKQKVSCSPVVSVAALAERLRISAGAALVAEEALIGVNIKPLVEWIASQAPWSDLPLLLLTGTGAELSEAGSRLLGILDPRANVTILERPIRITTLLSTIQFALRARRRQYEVQDYLSERERDQARIRETQKLESLGVLAGGVAHDFNNLLTGILGNATLALDTLDSGRPIDALLNKVVDAADRAADLTRQLLAYAGKGSFRVEPVDLSGAVQGITKLIGMSVPKSVKVLFDLAPNLPAVQADRTQLQQIVMNLVINGAEAIGPDRPGAIRLKTDSRKVSANPPTFDFGGEVIRAGIYSFLEVEDTGCGMGEETLARMFDPFFSTKFLGRGLGLAAVLGIVRAHQGSLQVESTEGRGTTFRVMFSAIAPAISSRTPDAIGWIPPTPGRDPD